MNERLTLDLKKIIIREALEKDAEKMIEYIKVIGSESENLTFDENGFPITIEQEKEFLQNTHENKTSLCLIACKGSEIIGDGSLTGLPRRMSHRAEMGLAVKKMYWNKGIGSMLIEKLIEYAKENDIEIINLEVRRDNASAIHLYEKYGFKSIGISPAYFKINRNYIDFELMYLDLR